MTSRLLPLRAATAPRHPLHATDRIWTETNCYVDLWIELLHALGVEPLAAACFCIAADFEDPQWSFFKFPPEDLRTLFGIEVAEMNVYRPVVEHVVDQLDRGRPLTVEVDAWYLPDTGGVSYRLDHTKTTIVPNEVDPSGRRLGYFHNAGYYELDGDDFDGVFGLGADRSSATLTPYVELVRLERLRRPQAQELTERSLDLLTNYVGRIPSDNPVQRLGAQVSAALPDLVGDVAAFHTYTFGTLRQCGACAEVASAYAEWLAARLAPARQSAAVAAAQAWRDLAEAAKSAQFLMARAVHGRNANLEPSLQTMAQAWAAAAAATADISDIKTH